MSLSWSRRLGSPRVVGREASRRASRWLDAASVVLLLLLAVALLGGQTPQTQPRIQAGDVTFVRTWEIPAGIGNPNGMGISDDGKTLYVGCYFGSNTAGVAAVSVPASGQMSAMISSCVPLPNLNQVHRGGTYLDVVPGGILAWNGKLIVTVWTYYDGGGGQHKAFYVGTMAGGFTGPYTVAVDANIPMYSATAAPRQMSRFEEAELVKAPPESFDLGLRRLAPGATTISWYREAMVGGWTGLVAPEWRSLLGIAMAGQCCVPIIGRTSFGPSVSLFSPSDVGVADPIQSWMFAGYPIEHKGLGEWDASPPSEFYGGTDQLGSVAFPSGTRSILLTGRHGDQFCYGPGTPDKSLVGTINPIVSAYAYCFDEDDAGQGNHGPPYWPTMFAFDAVDALAVKAGTKKPWDVRPYAKWVLPNMPTGKGHPNYLRAGTYHDPTRRLFVGDTSNRTVYEFAIGLGGTPPPPPPPPPTSKANITVNPSVTYQTMRGWELTAQADQFGSNFSTFIGPVLDKVVEAGYDRVRLEVRSGSENTRDWFKDWLDAGAVFSGPAYDAWRQHRYEIINDNADPNTAGTGFYWSELDDTTDRIVAPLKAKLLAARGENLYVNLTVVAFYNGVTTPNIFQQPAEYAEFMLEAFKHIQARYGWVPDAVNLILEPDNTTNWSGTLLGQVAVATRTRLAVAGFTPDIIAPSTTNMTTASTWGPQALAVPANGIKELSYHRYSGVNTQALQAIAGVVQKAGISSSMLECWPAAGCTSNYTVLHEDLTVGRVSAWQQSVFVDTSSASGHAATYVNLAAPTVATFTTPTLAFKQYYQSVRRGAVRLGATSTTTSLAPLAFRNTNGIYAVVVKATAPGPILISGLPAGTYGLTSTAGNAPDQTIAAGGVVVTNAVSAGVLTVASKLGPPPTPQDCIGSWARVAGSESACVNSTRTFQELFTIDTPASGGGTACPNPLTRLGSEACIMPPPPPASTTAVFTVQGTTLTCILNPTTLVWACK